MKYLALVLSLIIVAGLDAKAQDDSLKTAFWSAQLPEERMRLAYEISKPLVASEPDTVKFYLFKVLKDSAIVRNSKHLASCLNLVAVHNYYNGNYDSMLHYANRASAIFVSLHDTMAAVKSRKNSGIALASLGKYEKAIKIYFDVLEFYKHTSDSSSIAAILNDIGNTYSYMKDFKQSLFYQNEALIYLKTITNDRLIGNIFNSLGSIYRNMGERDSAIYYYEKSLDYKLRGGNIYSIMNTRNNLCILIDYKNNPEHCLECFQNLIKELRSVGDIRGIARSYINISISYDYHNDCENAISSLDSAGYYLGFSEDFFIKQEYLSNYASTLYKCGNSKLAYSFLDSLLGLKDSIFEVQKRKSMLELDTKYQTRAKADSIQVLDSENTANMLKVNKQKWQISFLFILVLSILGAGGSVFYYFRQRQILKRDLAIAQMREAERVRIARDMHDEIGSGLSRISLMGEQLKMLELKKSKGKPAKASKEENVHKKGMGSQDLKGNITRITAQSRDLSGSLKEIIWAIDPSNDKLDELLFYIRDYVYELFTDTDIKADLDFPDDLEDLNVGSEARRNLFLSVKEIINNIIKHSEAENVKVSFQLDKHPEGRMRDRYLNQKATITLSDDGKGFDPAQVKKGVGLDSIRARTEKLGGQMVLDTKPGKGTIIVLKNITLNTTKG
jgi:signal transduction histidine kinase